MHCAVYCSSIAYHPGQLKSKRFKVAKIGNTQVKYKCFKITVLYLSECTDILQLVVLYWCCFIKLLNLCHICSVAAGHHCK